MNKKHQLILVLLMAAVMLLCIVASVMSLPEKPMMERISFQDATTGLRLTPVYDEAEARYVLYLPAHATPEDIRVTMPGGIVRIRDTWGSLKAIPLEEDQTITSWSLQGRKQETLALYHCSGIPSLFIRGEKDTREHIHEDKANEAQVLAQVWDPDGQLVFSQAAVVAGRGNSSWDGQAKRPYELKFSSPVSFGPFVNSRKICLLAEYSDESKLRNSVCYFGTKALEIDYASGYSYVNVYWAGEYLGLYGIAVKDAYRDHIQTDGIQAVFEVTSNLDKQDFRPALGRNPVRVLYGDVEDVMSAVEGFESVLQYGSWQDCAAVIDSVSFARKYVAEELFANADMTFASQYFYLDEDDVIHCMLPWDYDLSLGYAFRYYNNKQVYEIESCKDPDGWYALLAQHPEFRQEALAVLNAYCTEPYLESLQSHLQQTAQMVAASWQCDILRWRNERPFTYFDLRCGEDSLEGMAALYGDYFPQRVAHLKAYLSHWEDFCRIEFDGIQYGNLVLPKGARLWDYLAGASILAGEKIDAGFQGWFTDAGLRPEDIDTVTGDILFTARYS